MSRWTANLLRRWLAHAAQRREISKATAELNAMADEQLFDLGIARDEIDAYVRGQLHRPARQTEQRDARPRLKLVWSRPEPTDAACCEPSPTCCPDRWAA